MREMTVETDGARLHVEHRGGGPVLLLIPGGGGDAGWFDEIAPALATEHLVVTYDRRGCSRSTGDSSGDFVRQQADDARAVLEAAGGHGVVFGTSSGAVIALELLRRHPAVVDALVAHEPPAIRVLPDQDDLRAELDAVVALHASQGWEPAFLHFLTLLTIGPTPPPEPLRTRLWGNSERFLRDELRPITEYEPDVETLRGTGVPLVLAFGERSRDAFHARTAPLIAAAAGAALAELPGFHNGFLDEPGAFAARLSEILQGVEGDLRKAARPASGHRAAPT